MSIEINEENDFDYIQDYFKQEIRTDFLKNIENKKVNSKDLSNIYQHFAHYNSAIKTLLESNQKLIDENTLLKVDIQDIKNKLNL